jgi:hypothetical protein
MVASLDKTQCEIDVNYILLGCCIPKKYSSEIMAVKCSMLYAGPLYTDVPANKFQAGEIRFILVIVLKWCFLCLRVDKSIVEEHHVSERHGPDFCR